MNTIKQKSMLFINFLLFFMITELLTFYTLGLGFVPNYLILDLAIAAILGSIIFLFKTKKGIMIYLYIWVVALIALYATNSTMFRIFGDIFSIEKLFIINEVEVNDVFEWDFIDPMVLLQAFILFLLFFMMNQLVCKFAYNKHTHIPLNHVKHVMMFASITLMGLVAFKMVGTKASENIYIKGEQFTETFYISSLKKSAFRDYGMLSFYVKEIKAKLTEPEHSSPVDVIDSQEQTKYFGLLEGKNVITIMIESGQEMAVHKELTPNIYQLREEGIYFSENYSVNKTNVSEHIGITGSYPSSMYQVDKYTYDLPFSIPHLLNDQYKTSYFHDNNGDFYKRDALMDQLGFENFYMHDDLFPEQMSNWDGSWSWSGDYTLDSVTVERILPHMITVDEPFYSFWTTLSMHGPYEDDERSNRDLFIKKGYFDKIEDEKQDGNWENPLKGDEKEAFQFKYYQAAMMDLDVAIGRILEELENKELLDDTLLVLYSDHHVYYHDLHLRLNDLKANEGYKMDLLYDTNMYMWNPTLNERVKHDYGTTTLETFSSPYIVVPTLLDLLGANYDSDWYMSLSYFDEDYLPLFYSHQQNAIMNNILYTTDIETINYRARVVGVDYEDAFLYNSMKLLQRQSRINNMYIGTERKE